MPFTHCVYGPRNEGDDDFSHEDAPEIIHGTMYEETWLGEMLGEIAPLLICDPIAFCREKMPPAAKFYGPHMPRTRYLA